VKGKEAPHMKNNAKTHKKNKTVMQMKSVATARILRQELPSRDLQATFKSKFAAAPTNCTSNLEKRMVTT
jgi:hypothetical protein